MFRPRAIQITIEKAQALEEDDRIVLGVHCVLMQGSKLSEFRTRADVRPG
jgi:hypothetical protein